MSEGLILIDHKGQILSMNNAAKRIYAVKTDVTGNNLLSVDRTNHMSKAVKDALGGEHSEFVIEKNGYEYQFNVNPIETDGKRLGAVILAFDITEKAFAERNRQEFTANVTHELKTPLQSIIGSAELLENGLVKPEDTERFVGNIRKEASRLVTLINDIIRLSQLDENHEPATETVNLREVANEVVEVLTASATKKDVALEVIGDACVIYGVRRNIYEIIYNLCDYAIRYIVSGGKVTRAKLFYDRAKDQSGILKNHDFCAFDEIQTIVFQEPAELQGALKSYLEQGKATIGDKEFTSECGLMLMGNIPLTEDRKPVNKRYFDALPDNFRESALLDRFHCFIEGWYHPRINKSMIFKVWTMNMEYFSEIMHTLRVQNVYAELFDKLVDYDRKAGVREFTAVKRIATAYIKLLFPHWTSIGEVNFDEFDAFCLQPANRRRGIIQEQSHYIDPEYKAEMPAIWVR